MFRWLFGDTPQRRYEEGMRLYNEGDLESALASFDRALEGLGDQSHPYTALTRFYRAETQAKLGARLLHDGNDAEALRYLDAALAEQPGYPDLHFRRGVACYRLGEPGEAEESARRALEINRDLAEARILLSVILRERGEGESATEEVRRARQAGRRRPTALTRFLDQGPAEPSAEELWEHLFDEESLRRRIEKAEGLYHAGELEESRLLLEDLVRRYPDFPDLRLKLALIHFQYEDHAHALIHLERALEANPRFGDALVLSAALLLHQGQVEKARRRYEEARSGVALPSPFADYGLAVCRYLLGDAEGCDELVRPLLRQGEVPVEALALLACSRALEGQVELARAGFADLLGHRIEESWRLDAAAFYLEEEEQEEAEQALQPLPTYGEAPALVLARVWLFHRQGRRDEALHLLERYRGDHGTHPALGVEEARLLHRAGEVSLALLRLEEVLSRWPESAEARRERVRILRRDGRVADAAEEMQRLRRLLGVDLETEIDYLHLLRQSARVEEAASQRERLDQLHPLDLRVRSQCLERWLGPLTVSGGEPPAASAEPSAP